MNTDIEDYIISKNNSGNDHYNIIDYKLYDFEKCRILFQNLFIWIYKNIFDKFKDSVSDSQI